MARSFVQRSNVCQCQEGQGKRVLRSFSVGIRSTQQNQSGIPLTSQPSLIDPKNSMICIQVDSMSKNQAINFSPTQPIPRCRPKYCDITVFYSISWSPTLAFGFQTWIGLETLYYKQYFFFQSICCVISHNSWLE